MNNRCGGPWSNSVVTIMQSEIIRGWKTRFEAGERVGGLDGNVRCRKRLGGLLNYYHREAA